VAVVHEVNQRRDGVSGAETKQGAYRRLAEKRTNAILDKVRILANLANPYAYEWDGDDVRRVFDAIEEEVRLAKGKFIQAQRSRRQFKLT